ncbi:MAG TPA: peptidoglycan recognition family protein [Pyrinomonadaceae bacterium]|nr:peptidoglycan recognition family protein [Pyrinomonadaceae bacterium]
MSQRLIADSTLNHSRVVERYAHFFDRPEVRLRFLNNTLAEQARSGEKLERTIGRFSFVKGSRIYQRLLELELYRLIFQELKRLLPSAAKERRRLLRRNKAPFSARLFFRCYQLRHVFCGAGIVMAAFAVFGLYTLVARPLQSAFAERRAPVVPTAGAEARTPEPYLHDYRPERVWLVERKDNYERYSNGARVLVDYETENRNRAYSVLQRGDTTAVRRVGREVVGIVYHTSESDMLPFTSDNNDSIETRSRGLLEYVRKNKSYNYLIDRFGQIYRVVRDEHAANHSGNSVWADAEGVYVGLNESFLGVCFETNSTSADSVEEQLTEAQVIAGRLLTQVLRSRHQIDDANCVTHGLVSVNPSNMLICFHHDWARNFPFEAMGLSDKYKVAPAAVSEFGFTYDEEILAKLGGALWPGVAVAETEFNRRAEGAGLAPEDLRARLRERYREQMAQQVRLRSSLPPSEAAADKASSPRVGSGAPGGGSEQAGQSGL